jgi:hypothetical protein
MLDTLNLAPFWSVPEVSEATPIKIAGFPFDWAAFEGKQRYSEWRFVYRREVEVKVGAR